ncbi:hypothetical protein CC86DRAFT_424508 [Ophiobolus disseminans]|uniref:Uncharacterized protein n=1 Tax=Ophiobolus disseminans TaxID=1469910 RepID=A0A6A7AFZ8_9PLEO|nr:hypothetical protein CC86DRAFT_424508 [Ophiobolus disseminans]
MPIWRQCIRYSTVWRENLTEAYGNKTTTSVKFYEFGSSDTGCIAVPPKQTTPLTTFCISKWMKDYLPSAYTVTSNTAYADNVNASDFDPIPDFKVSSADVTLISILNKAVYNGRVDDELFNASIKAPDNDQFFLPTNDFSVLGCTEQYQFCNAVTKQCTKLDGLYATQEAVRRGDIALSKRQQAMFSVMWDAAWSMVLQWTARLLNSQVLLAQDWVFTATSFGSSSLAPGQWQREAHNMHNVSLAMFQHRIDRHSSPDTFELRPGQNALSQLQVPTDPDILDICKRQRILSARHYSVSVLGMAIILSVGSLLIILDQSMEALWFRYFNARERLAQRAEWTQTGTLQLHRQALEARGIGTWDRKHHDFPVIEGKDKTFTGLGDREEEIGQNYGEEKAQYQVVEEEVSPYGGSRGPL